MIAEKYPPDEPTNFTLLIPDMHCEYPLDGNQSRRHMPELDLIWNPWNLQMRLEANGIPDSEEIIHDLACKLFPYPHFDHDAAVNIWQVRGSVGEIGNLILYFSQMLMGGPLGGDDDTFDYWPNAFEMLIELVRDYLTITGGWAKDYPNFYIGLVDRVVQSAIALEGPPEDWEADGITNAVPGLEKLAKELAS